MSRNLLKVAGSMMELGISTCIFQDVLSLQYVSEGDNTAVGPILCCTVIRSTLLEPYRLCTLTPLLTLVTVKREERKEAQASWLVPDPAGIGCGPQSPAA